MKIKTTLWAILMACGILAQAEPLTFITREAPYSYKEIGPLIYPYASNDTPVAHKINQIIAAQLYAKRILHVSAENYTLSGERITAFTVDDTHPNFVALSMEITPDGDDQGRVVRLFFDPHTGKQIFHEDFFRSDISLEPLKESFTLFFDLEKQGLLAVLNHKLAGAELTNEQQAILKKYALHQQDPSNWKTWANSLSQTESISYYCQHPRMLDEPVHSYLNAKAGQAMLEISCVMQPRLQQDQTTTEDPMQVWNFSYPLTEKEQESWLSPYGKCLLSPEPKDCAETHTTLLTINTGDVYPLKYNLKYPCWLENPDREERCLEHSDPGNLSFVITRVWPSVDQEPMPFVAVLFDGTTPIDLLLPEAEEAPEKVDSASYSHKKCLIIPYKGERRDDMLRTTPHDFLSLKKADTTPKKLYLTPQHTKISLTIPYDHRNSRFIFDQTVTTGPMRTSRLPDSAYFLCDF